MISYPFHHYSGIEISQLCRLTSMLFVFVPRMLVCHFVPGLQVLPRWSERKKKKQRMLQMPTWARKPWPTRPHEPSSSVLLKGNKECCRSTRPDPRRSVSLAACAV